MTEYKINLLDYFLDTVNKYPNKIAIKDEYDEISFKNLHKKALELSTLIIQKTNGLINNPIAIYLPKEINSIISFLAVMYSGNIYMPMDTNAPNERTLKILDNIKPMMIISNKKLDFVMDCLELDINETVENSTTNVKTNYEKTISNTPAYIINTSGSTGVPKGVVISHGSVIDYILWAKNEYNVDDDIIITSQAPFFFDNSVLDVYLCLFSGAKLLLPQDNLMVYPNSLIEYMIENKSNHIFWVPSLLSSFYKLQALDEEIPDLKNILFAGEVMPVKHLKYWQEKFPNATISNLYGSTEITVDATFYTIKEDLNNLKIIPIGKPCKNTTVLIEKNGKLITDKNITGELCIKGISLALGYYKDSEKTNAVFYQTPEHNNYRDMVYKTGDLVYYDENSNLVFVGRKDFQIKHMGYRIDLGEIETAVLSHKEIKQGLVFYKNNRIQLVYEAINELSKADLNNYLSTLLPKYMI